jgi:hypothetical protein
MQQAIKWQPEQAKRHANRAPNAEEYRRRLRYVAEYWEIATPKAIGDTLGVAESSVFGYVKILRKAGLPMSHRKPSNSVDGVLRDQGFIESLKRIHGNSQRKAAL